MTTAELMARRDQVFGRGSTLFYEHPVHLVRGEGVWVYDAEGRRYLDMYNNVPVVGHCNPAVVAAMTRQASTLQTHSRYLHGGVVDYGERLLALHAPELDALVLACTGTEANEIAMGMARIVTGGRGFICTDATYHGHSALVGSLTRAPRRGRPDVHAIAFPQTYRPIEPGLSEADLCERYLDEVRSAIADFAAEGVPLAGMIMCSLLANEGLPRPPAGFMAGAAALVRAAGGVVIFDEVQAGFCRSGRWWGYESSGVVPDIVTMGKPMGNGFPLAGCAAKREFVEAFRAQTRYFNTFGASPVHAAVGMAVLDEIEGRELPGQVGEVAEYLVRQITELTAAVEWVGQVRNRGLFVAVETVVDRDGHEPDRERAVQVVNRLKDHGILASNAGAHGNCVKLRPPLVFEWADADYFLDRFAHVLGELHA